MGEPTLPGVEPPPEQAGHVREAADRFGSSPAGEVFRVFLKLGLTSFGGPVAHLGYFRDEFVSRRRWIDEPSYADLVALCQFLPGPASSQVGFALGLMRGGGLLGGLAAWIGFTAPSALLLVAFAYGSSAFGGPLGLDLIHGLKLVAVAVVAQAVLGMVQALAPDRERAAIALGAVILVGSAGSAFGQIGAIAIGAAAGLRLCRGAPTSPVRPLAVGVSPRAGTLALVVFAVLLVVPSWLARAGVPSAALFDAFYRSGAFVFGGGHVVLPLLRAEVVGSGWVGPDAFLAGYGAAQAVPGPLFTFAAYLGAISGPAPNGILGALIALVAVFLPGLLLILGSLPFWGLLRRVPPVQAAMRGANAAVVGILGAALYDPVWVGAVASPGDFALALTAFVLLTAWRTAPWIVVILTAIAAVMSASGRA